MEAEEFAELLSHYPIIRPSDYIADCWVCVAGPFHVDITANCSQ